jgi:RNA polymerase sigma factor (sigma-70 family)
LPTAPDPSDLAWPNRPTCSPAGDPRAVELFYSQYFDFLYQHARRATGRDEAFCLDVVQDAVIRILRTIRRAESQSQLRAWLGLVVRTTAYDLLKSERRRAARQAVLVPAEEDRDETGDQRLDALRREIAKLDPQLIQLIELRFERQWTLARIAAKLGLTIGTVDGRLRRALLTLRSRLTED